MKDRGVIFASQINNYTFATVGTIHEVFKDQEDRDEVIERLQDTSFFKNWAKQEKLRCKEIVWS